MWNQLCQVNSVIYFALIASAFQALHLFNLSNTCTVCGGVGEGTMTWTLLYIACLCMHKCTHTHTHNFTQNPGALCCFKVYCFYLRAIQKVVLQGRVEPTHVFTGNGRVWETWQKKKQSAGHEIIVNNSSGNGIFTVLSYLRKLTSLDSIHSCDGPQLLIISLRVSSEQGSFVSVCQSNFNLENDQSQDQD